MAKTRLLLPRFSQALKIKSMTESFLNRTLFLTIAMLLSLQATHVAANSSAGAGAGAGAAVITSVSGTSFVSHEGQIKPLAPNDSVFQGDLLTTGPTGSIKMIFSDDSILDLGPQTSFRVEKFTASGPGDRVGVFSLLYGRMRSLVTKAIGEKSKLEIRTQDAVMGVRGTELVVNSPQSGAGSGQTELTVLTGSVAMSIPKLDNATVEVGAGAQAIATPTMATAPQAIKLDSTQLAGVAQASRVSDSTFERTVSVDEGVRNDKAPPLATNKLMAMASIAVAKDTVTEGAPPTLLIKGPGAFNPFDAMSGNLVRVVPKTFQTFTVRLAR